MSGLQDSRLPWLLVVVRERTGHGAEERSGHQDRSWWPWTKIQLAHPENQAASLQNSWYLTMRRWTISQHLWVLQNEGLQRLHGPPLFCSPTLSPPFSSSETLPPGSLLPLFSTLPSSGSCDCTVSPRSQYYVLWQHLLPYSLGQEPLDSGVMS